MNRQRHLVHCVFLLLLVLPATVPHGVRARENRAPPDQSPAGQIGPPDVLVRVSLLGDEIELIRIEQGKPRTSRAQIQVENVAPREVFFQALTLFRKANRLCFEMTSETAPEPAVPSGLITPAQVWAVVSAALDRVRQVKDRLGITAQSVEPSRHEDRTPTDVFRSIVDANRQLNLLLDRPFSPSDVFQQVTLALSYTSRLRARFPGSRMPDTPAFEPGKRPADVYRRLLDCLRRIRSITQLSGIEGLKFHVRKAEIETATPSDVYDIASLIVSEVSHLHSRLENPRPARETHYRGNKLPSHVYQRAGLLETQLADLEVLIGNEPTWMNDDTRAARSPGAE